VTAGARPVALFIHSLGSGGAERAAANLANHLASSGRAVVVVTTTGLQPESYRLDPSIRLVPLDLASGGGGVLRGLAMNLRRIRALGRTLDAIGPEAVVSFMNTANVLLALTRPAPGRLRIGCEQVHPPAVPLGWPWEWLRRRSYGRLDAVVALTGRSATWIERNTTARCAPVIVNPVVWPLPGHEPLLRPSSVTGDGRRVILAVGRLDPQKGFDLLLTAFAGVIGTRPGWDLVVLGEGAERGRLEAQAAGLGLAGRVFLPGRAGNMADWYRRAALFVMSSRFEGFPNALAEAMAHGLPAVSFDCDTGPAEIIRPGLDGLLVPAGDTGALAEAMAALMDDDSRRAAMAAEAETVRDRFSIGRIGAQWEELFRSLAAGPSRAGSCRRPPRLPH
jgi:glycosyltransferase involved in cell wall biosynthesis